MSHVASRRFAALALAGATTLGAAVAPVVAQATAPVKPNVSHVKVAPSPAVQGHGFKISFKSTSGGNYVVYYSTGQMGGPLAQGTAKKGLTVTKKVGKSLHAIKGLTVGVILTSGAKTVRATTKVTIKR